MLFQVGIDSLGRTVLFSGGTLYPSVNYDYIMYIQSDYCCSALFQLFLAINFIISCGEDNYPYSINSLILSVLTLIIFLYKPIYSQ